jgi:hypothetical protein
MTMAAKKESLVQRLDRAVQDVLAYFEGPGRTTTARVESVAGSRYSSAFHLLP